MDEKLKEVYCHVCSKAGGANMPIYHEPPICGGSMDDIQKIRNRLAVEYHISETNDTPIIDWRQALQDVAYLLSKIKELEEGIQEIIDSGYMNSLNIKDKLKKLLRNNPT